jgi:hypothetical protein
MSVVLQDVQPRLEAAVAEVADARLQLEVALERRDALVVQAVDEGMQQSRVAKLAQVSAPHVVKILAKSQPDAVLPR